MVTYTTANFEWRDLDYAQGPKVFPGGQPTRLAIDVQGVEGQPHIWRYRGKWHPGILPHLRRLINNKGTLPNINSIQLGEFDQNGLVWHLGESMRLEWARTYHAVPTSVIMRANVYGRLFLGLQRKRVLVEKKYIWVSPILFSGRTGLHYSSFVRDAARGIMRADFTGTENAQMTNLVNEKGTEFFGVKLNNALPAHLDAPPRHRLFTGGAHANAPAPPVVGDWALHGDNNF